MLEYYEQIEYIRIHDAAIFLANKYNVMTPFVCDATMETFNHVYVTVTAGESLYEKQKKTGRARCHANDAKTNDSNGNAIEFLYVV